MTTPKKYKYPENGDWSYVLGEGGFFADSLDEAIDGVSDSVINEISFWDSDFIHELPPKLQEKAKQALKKKFAQIREECLTTGSACSDYWSIWYEGDNDEVGEVEQ